MNKITLTVSVDGNEVSRIYGTENVNWQFAVEDMLDTIEQSTKPMKLEVKHL